MDVNENYPTDLKAMNLVTFKPDLTTTLTSRNSESRQRFWDRLAAKSLETQDFLAQNRGWRKRQSHLSSANRDNL